MIKYNHTLLLCSLLFLTGSAYADTYAIVIGIDAYKNFEPSLSGAVNDAKKVAESLESIGAKVKLYLDDKATRSEIMKAWDEVSASAKKGDTVFFTYAGHGSQEPERIKGTESDGRDEFFVLSNFSETAPNNSERLLDNDLREWFSARPDLNIVLLADACHSGTMTRGYKRAKLKVRRVISKPIVDDTLPVPTKREFVDEQKKLPNVFSLAGVPDDKEVSEIYIDNTPHGALSVYFAKGITGSADADQNGIVSASELKNYLLEKVRMETDGQQQPQIVFENDIAITNQNTAALKNRGVTVNLSGELPPITFSVIQSPNNQEMAKLVIAKLNGIIPETSDKSLLEWDIESGIILNQFNDNIYHFPVVENKTKAYKRKTDISKEISPELIGQLQSVINKFRFVEKLKTLSDGSMAIKLLPSDKLHMNGETVSLQIDRLKYRYLTLINLAVDGTVNFLYPSEKDDPLQIPEGKPYQLDLEVSAPFGADHFVAIATDKPLSTVHDFLNKLDGSGNSQEALRNMLDEALKGVNSQIGIHASFTENSL